MSLGSPLGAIETEPSLGRGNSASSPKIRVCHVASGDRWAGAEVQLATLLRALAARKELALSAIFLNGGRLAEEARQSGVEVCVIPEAEHNFFEVLSQSAHFLRGRGVRILHSHRYKENMLAALLRNRCRVPFLVRTEHGAPERFVGWRSCKQGLIHRLDRFVARRSTDCVVSVSSELCRHLARHLPPNKIVTIHNGIDREKVLSPLTVSEAKQRLGMGAECRVIGAAGRLEPVKRLDTFLLAAKEIAGRHPNTRFVIAGEGQEEPRLRDLALKLGLEERVLFLGHRNDIYDVLRAMDIFVLCSEHEGLPMVLLEALYLGVLVVARPVGGIAEVIEDGISGVLLGSADPSCLARVCLEVLGDKERSGRIVKAGIRLVAERFGVEQTAAEVAKLYKSLSDAR